MLIQILLFNLMRTRIRIFIPDLDPPLLQNDPLRLPPFHLNVDPDPAFHFHVDPDPATQNDADRNPQK